MCDFGTTQLESILDSCFEFILNVKKNNEKILIQCEVRKFEIFSHLYNYNNYNNMYFFLFIVSGV